MNKTLIAYFSYQGHTRQLAQHIQKATDGTLFEIKPAQAYLDDYDTCEAQAKKETAKGISRNWRKSATSHRTVRFCSARPTGSIRWLRLSPPFWLPMISPGKPFFPSVPTAGEEWAIS